MKDFEDEYPDFYTNLSVEYVDTFKWCAQKAGLKGAFYKNAYDTKGDLIPGVVSVWVKKDTPNGIYLKFDKIFFCTLMQIYASLKKQDPCISASSDVKYYFGCEQVYTGPGANCITKEQIEKILKEKGFV